LLSQEWVEERCVTGVEVEIEGERWVTDLHYEELSESENGNGKDRKEKEKLKKRGVKEREDREREREVLRRAWEGSVPSRKGEWRRRRWVRGVERVPVTNSIE
jgi:hypothetical protein